MPTAPPSPLPPARQVEAVLLASAVLVCLSGIMFSSDRFTGSLAGYYVNEYNGLVR